MTEITLNSEQLKDVLKSAIVELLQDNKEEFYKLFAEIFEDLAIERAISLGEACANEEGETTELVSREAILPYRKNQILESRS